MKVNALDADQQIAGQVQDLAARMAEIERDLSQCLDELRRRGLSPVAALAFPYGADPRGWRRRRAAQAVLARAGIACAFRVGNRINHLPSADRYALRRLDVRSGTSLDDFRRMLGQS